MIWTLLLIVIVLVIGYLLFFYDNGFSGFKYNAAPVRDSETRPYGSVSTVTFPAKDGQDIEGWLYLPNTGKKPLIIMAPGLTGTKEGPLERFAWRFVEEGFAVLSIDFRTFGGSKGFPRHWMDPFRQMEDYEATINYVRANLSTEIDINNIILWGTSFSGGVAISVAGQRSDIAAVIVQAPFLETSKELEPSKSAMIRYVSWTTLDLVRSQLTRISPIKLRPVYMPVYGKPGEFAFAPSKENPSRTDQSQNGGPFWQTLPSQFRGGWENKMVVRFLADFDHFKPMEHASEIECPIYFVGAEDDDLVPAAFIHKAFDKITHEKKKLTMHSCGHFDLYTDPVFEENVNLQAQFIHTNLS